MPEKRFQKKVENFICEHCGAENVGTGYTNHCRVCLWSKHVDKNPGDRAEVCDGMMEPIKVEFEKGEYVITHRCVKCGFERRKKVETDDNFDVVVALAKKQTA